ncbi:MAG: hypothetical protein ACE5OP_13705 [Candidatus Glassbacteria bacterium]
MLLASPGVAHVCHSQIKEVNAVKANDGVHSGETAIAVDPTDSEHLMAAFVYLKGGVRHLGYAFSTDGGNTWPDTGYFSFTGVDPSCGFDEDRNAYYAYIRLDSSIYVSKRVQGSWLDPTYVASGGDKPYMAVDNNDDNVRDGYIYVAWTKKTDIGFTPKFSYSTDGGSSFSNPKIVDDPPGGDFVAPIGAVPAVGESSDVYLTWARIDAQADVETVDVCFNKWEVGDTFFVQGSIKELADVDDGLWFEPLGGCGLRIAALPTIAVDTSKAGDDYIYVAYTQHKSNDEEDYDIYYVRSTDGGDSWSGASSAVAYNSSKEFFPWLTVTPLGKICLAFVTNLHCSGSCADLYLAHGTTMSSLDTLAITSDCKLSGAGYYDYIGIASSLGFAYPCWTQKLDDDADVYMAIVDFPPSKPAKPSVADSACGAYLTWDANPENDIDYYEVWRKIKYSKYNQTPWR